MIARPCHTLNNACRLESPPAILVTGASRGIGRGIALELAGAGWSVAIHYVRDERAASSTADDCRVRATSSAQQFPIIQGDIAIAADRSRVFAATVEALGPVDALINNAGMAPRVRADILDATEASFDEVLDVNLKGPYFLSQLTARGWLARPKQSRLPGAYKLIFVTSISAATASVNRGEYCISKAGLSMACALWAARLAGEGISVVEIRPGIMATDMTASVRDKYDHLIAQGLVPQRRWGEPADVGRTVRAVLDGSLPYSTGQVLHVDGGFHLRTL